MNILFVSDTYYPHINGVYYFVCRLAPRLQKKGHRIAVIAPSENIYPSLKKIDEIDVYGVPSLPVLYYPVRFAIPFLLVFRIKQIINEFKPDIVHIQDHFSISRAALKVSTEYGIPTIGTNHFMTENLTSFIHSEKWKKRISDIFWVRFSKVFNKLVLATTPSETAAILIRPKLNVKVIPVSSGIDLKIFNPYGDTKFIRKKYGIPEKPVLLFVGRLDPEKKIEEILHAVSLTLKKIDFSFVIIGRGVKKVSLQRCADKLGISENVLFTGFVPEEDLPFLYKLSRCFIIASIAELLSLSALQGMASGLPIIAVNKGALGELVHDSINGYLFESGDIATMVRCIYDIIDKDDIYKKMSERSLEYVRKHDIQETVDSFEKLYQTNCLS